MIGTIADAWGALRVQLRDARQALKITQESAAHRMTDEVPVGERRSWLSRIENGRAVPSVTTVIGLARAFDLELVAVPRQLSHLLTLDGGEVVAILRAASAATSGRHLDPMEAYRVRQALQKVSQ